MVKIVVPQSLAKYANNLASIFLDCKSLNELGSFLQRDYPVLYSVLYDEKQNLKNYVCLYLNSKLMYKSLLTVDICSDDTIEIVIAVAGG